MAQHIPIKNIKIEAIQKIYKSICRQFEKGVLRVRLSLKYQEIEDEDYKENKDDRVFNTWRTVNGEREAFEIHYNLSKNKITNIYLVK